jgi:hypothetical protein
MKKIFLAGALLIAFGQGLSAQNSLWQSTIGAATSYPSFTFKLNADAFEQTINAAGASINEAVEVNLPNPDGKTQTYKVWKNTLFAPELAAKYSEINTFTGYSEGKKGVTLKMEYSPRGLFVMVFDGSSTYIIDPINKDDASYKAYYKGEAILDQANSSVFCEFENEQSEIISAEAVRVNTAAFTTGQERKVYRLALSCTGEYAQAVSGPTATVADVLAAMATTMNRVNGIYEREFGITMQFIANNDLVVYTDPATDPYTANNNGSTLMGQNHSNMNTVIGLANFDIGHIFSTGGGGIAQLEGVCRNNRKSRGVTGRPNPVGDPFDVDYVAHEMGHQFGANHSFNKCTGTENQSTAYEPGSGSTIMAYAGICGTANNIQNNSDDYFHRASLVEINQALATGNPADCGVASTGIAAPVFVAPTASYVIPRLTPFLLEMPTITAATAGNTVLSNIEQYDLGNYRMDENLSVTFTNGPAFRTIAPDTVASRTFPRMSVLRMGELGGKGERLSSVGRSYKFAYLAREVQSDGWGAVNAPNTFTNITVAGNAGPFEMIYPNLQDSLIKNESTPILWEVAGSDLAPINCSEVDILLSTDGGFTFPIVLAQHVLNTGQATVTIPDIETNSARIQVRSVGNVFFTFSKANVNIGNTASAVDTGTANTGVRNVAWEDNIKVFPNPASNQINVSLETNISGQIVLINAIGQEVWRSSITKGVETKVIPTGSFARGFYFLQIREESGQFMSKKVSLQ